MYIIRVVCGKFFNKNKKGMFVVFGVMFSKKIYNHHKIGKNKAPNHKFYKES